EAYINEFSRLVSGIGDQVEIVIIPPFTAINKVATLLKGANIRVGAQNMHNAPAGEFTGEISPLMLVDAGATHVVLGHSERRKKFGETDAFINMKLKTAHEHGLTPIVCIGETGDEREHGKTFDVLQTQITGSLAGIEKPLIEKTVLAYEPVWAIGTGKTTTPKEAQDAHSFIRSLLVEIYDQDVAKKVRIQYGGSMKPENAKELFKQPDIDGGLVGGASLKPDAFSKIIHAALE
nr:triose-phosphate isomerase [Candidatus Sigynarchaeota archaeon]